METAFVTNLVDLAKILAELRDDDLLDLVRGVPNVTYNNLALAILARQATAGGLDMPALRLLISIAANEADTVAEDEASKPPAEEVPADAAGDPPPLEKTEA